MARKKKHKIKRLEAQVAKLEAEKAQFAEEKAYLVNEAVRHMKKKVRDPLTGVFNKTHMGYLRDVYATVYGGYGFVNIDADDFSKINNEHGHLAGDAAIGALVDRLNYVFKRKEEIIGRVGGDEFWVLLPTLDEKMEDHIYEQIETYVNKPLSIDEIRGYLTLQGHKNTDSYDLKNGKTSINLSVTIKPARPKKGETTMDFFKRAETGLYDQKELRRKLGLREGRRRSTDAQ